MRCKREFLLALQEQDFRPSRQFGLAEKDRIAVMGADRVQRLRLFDEFLHRPEPTVMHQDDQFRANLRLHAKPLAMAHGHETVDRRERDIDAAELTQLLFRQHVMQMTDMNHAEIGGLENEHGVAIRHPAGDIGQVVRYVADPHVFDKQIMPRDTALRIPAA